MSEAWRKKRYYKPRIIMSTSDILENPFPGRLVYLSGAETSLIRNLLAYATRRVTFATSYSDQYYLTPTTEEWDTLQAIVASLEDTLMTDCCETLNATLEAIAATLEATGVSIGNLDTSLAIIDTTLQTMDTSLEEIVLQAVTSNSHQADVVTALECICGRLEIAGLGQAVDPKWTENANNFDVWTWGKEEPNPSVGAQVDLAACQLAQLWYQAGYELLSEVILPALRFGFDTVIPAAATLVAAWTGGLALPVAIGVYATAELIQELLELGYDSAETNLINWLWANKQDLVCPMYLALKDGGSASSMWPAIWAAVVEPSEDISYGDKLLIKLFMGGLALSGAKVAFDAETTWATTVPTPGYCDTCEEEPIIGADWVAIPYTDDNKIQTVVHPDEQAWHGACAPKDLPDGYTCVGMFFEVSDVTGDCDLKAMDGPGAGCDGTDSYVPNNSYLLSEGWYYYRDEWNHDHDEAVADVHPGATQVDIWENPSGDVTSLAWMTGWDCEGAATFTIQYLVYGGTTPP